MTSHVFNSRLPSVLVLSRQGHAVRSKTHENSVVVQAGKGRRSGPSGSRDPPVSEVSEDVEIFSLESGWNVKAMVNDKNLLNELDGWGVLSTEDEEEEEEPSGDEDVDISLNIDEWGVGNGLDDEDEDEDEFEFTTSDIQFVEKNAATKSKAKSSAGGASKNGKNSKVDVTDSGSWTSAEEDLLRSLPDHVVRELAVAQAEADAEEARLKPAVQRKEQLRRRTHRQLRIISGTAAGKRILSPQGDQTRPMMEMVRGAIFSMIASMHGSPLQLPDGTRWLDLFAGTGAIGIEAISRGCAEAHFIELSPWVVSNCLLPNIDHCDVDSCSVVHTGKAEDFLKRAIQVPRFAGGAFDFISVCPPYELVSYPELYDLLEKSPLLHDQSVVVVEYPKKLASEVRDTLGPLVKLRDRRYGRTYIAVYGPSSGDEYE